MYFKKADRLSREGGTSHVMQKQKKIATKSQKKLILHSKKLEKEQKVSKSLKNTDLEAGSHYITIL